MARDMDDLGGGGRRNYAILFAVSVLIGLGVAVYEVALPLYFKRIGMSWLAMGWVYGAAALVTFVIRVGIGAWSDRVGRKRAYVLSLLATGLATWVTPLFRSFYAQGALRSVAEPTMRVREAMHSVLLYEDSPKRFRRIFSRTRGVEFLFHFLGLLVAAAVVGRLAGGGSAPETWLFRGAAVVLFAAGIVFALGYRERPTHSPARPRLMWRDLLHPRLPRPMWVMAISNFVFMFGVMISHCFALQLFFKEKYGASDQDIFVIGAFHRLACALPLLFVGHVFRKRLKLWLMLFLVVEGVMVALPGFMRPGSYSFAGIEVPALWTAVVLWLGHDLLGMGLWLPIQHELLQRHSRPESRGKDISLATALGALGAVGAPFAAGWLRDWPGVADNVAVNLPFIFSGLGVVCSAGVLFFLPGGRNDE